MKTTIIFSAVLVAVSFTSYKAGEKFTKDKTSQRVIDDMNCCGNCLLEFNIAKQDWAEKQNKYLTLIADCSIVGGEK